MSREYTVKLSEEELKLLMDDIIYCVDHKSYREERGIIHLKVYLSKTLPYTNFDKIKDEMKLIDYARLNKMAFNLSSEKAHEYAMWLESEVKDEH